MATAGGGRGAGPERAWVRDLPDEGLVRLDADESAHLVRSRRVRVGDGVVLVDGRGRTRLGRLTSADPRAASVLVEGAYPDRRPPRTVRLAVSLPEAGRADRMVAALAELGVAGLAPLVCARTPTGRCDLRPSRRARWQRLAREAAKVNGCSVFLEVAATLRLDEALRPGAILLDPDPSAPSLAEVVGANAPSPWLLVGPEGGFEAGEIERAHAAGAVVARVGALALRTETAAVAAAALALAP